MEYEVGLGDGCVVCTQGVVECYVNCGWLVATMGICKGRSVWVVAGWFGGTGWWVCL
jgi:hypothetical protein